MKKKGIIISLIVIVILIISIKPAYAYYQYRQEVKRFSQEPYFTEHKLSLREFVVMKKNFYVDEKPTYVHFAELDMSDWPDYSYYTIEETETTYILVEVLNYYLFDELSEDDLAGREKAEEYGFSPENRITVEWVMSHPKEAVQIMYGMWENGEIYRYSHRVKYMYNEIMGVSENDLSDEEGETASTE